MGILQLIRYYSDYYFKSSKYVRKGKCKMCGKCCREILLYINDKPITTEKGFESLKEFNPHYRSFHISGRDENGALLFTCNALKDNGKCGIYPFRGLICRTYPNPNSAKLSNGAKLIEGCGYYFEPDKDFKSFLPADKQN